MASTKPPLVISQATRHMGHGMSPNPVRSQYELRARATLGYREKKMSPGKVYVSHVYYAVYILYTDYYYQIIIELAQLRQHKQRLNDLRTQLG